MRFPQLQHTLPRACRTPSGTPTLEKGDWGLHGSGDFVSGVPRSPYIWVFGNSLKLRILGSLKEISFGVSQRNRI